MKKLYSIKGHPYEFRGIENGVAVLKPVLREALGEIRIPLDEFNNLEKYLPTL